MAEQLLSLETLARPTVAVDGHAYEMLLPDDFGIQEIVRIRRLQVVASEVQAKAEAELTDADLIALGDALDGGDELLPGRILQQKCRGS